MISAVIVFAVAVVVAGWMNRDLIRIKIASVYAPVSPKPAAPNAAASPNPVPLRGDAPWALSALPECLTQMSETTGPRAYVTAHLPPGSRLVVPPARISYADCTISIVGDEAYVSRGEDRFRIPPHAWFYRVDRTLALLRESSHGGFELRVYQPTQP